MPQSANTGSIKDLIRHPLLIELYEYWKILAPSDDIPLKTKFDPVDLSAALWPRLHMIDIPPDGSICRNRLLGTYVVDAVGVDFTGLQLVDNEITGVTASITYRLLQELLSTSKPQHYFGPPSFGLSSRFKIHEQILLPFCDEMRNIIVAVGALDYLGFSPGLFNHGNG